MSVTAEFSAMPVSASVYNKADFEAVRALLHAQIGIVLPDGKAMLVYSRLAPRVRDTGSATFAKYVMLLERDPDERQRAISALTTNHTFFFRENHHFEHFASVVRPALIDRLQRGGRARLWSAGCSSGEETWSLVMTLLGPDRAAARLFAQYDLAVLATDIADHALATARAARYPVAAIEAMPANLRALWTQRQGDDVVIAPEATDLVRFRRLNLLGEWPMRQPFDVIFCRNVMIYFDQPTKERLIARLARALAPGGMLYIGHSERVSGPAENVLKPVGNTIYLRSAA